MSVWDEYDRTARLHALRRQGLSFSQIAADMSLTRMQVGNKIRRLRLGKAAGSGRHRADEYKADGSAGQVRG